MKFEQLVQAVASIKESHHQSEGWPCGTIIKALGMDASKARELIAAAVADGVLVRKPYYNHSSVGYVSKRMGLGLPTATTGKKKTKRS